MIYNGELIGKYVIVRSVKIEDAKVTLEMRLDKKRTRFLHPVKDDIDAQIKWIETSRNKPGEYHFTITDLNGTIIGNTALYDIENGSAQIGRTLINGNALQNFETYLLVIRFGFEYLKLNDIWGICDTNNTSAMRFSGTFGFIRCEPKYDPDQDIYYTIGHLDYTHFKESEKKVCKMIYR